MIHFLQVCDRINTKEGNLIKCIVSELVLLNCGSMYTTLTSACYQIGYYKLYEYSCFSHHIHDMRAKYSNRFLF